MNDIYHYVTFLLKTRTKDNYYVIVGGFCPEDKKEETIFHYSRINNYKIGQSKDEYIIDYSLANTISQISPTWVSVVGASISIDGVKGSTGGIIGNPFEQIDSSQEEIEEITKGMYLISLPGGPGVALKAEYSDTLMLKDKILIYKNEKCSFEDIINELDKVSDLYILVEDGCGLINRGGIYVSDFLGKRYETF